MTGLEPIGLPRFFAERRDRVWFVVDRDREHEPPQPMRHGMAQARDVARLLNAQVAKARTPAERGPHAG